MTAVAVPAVAGRSPPAYYLAMLGHTLINLATCYMHIAS